MSKILIEEAKVKQVMDACEGIANADWRKWNELASLAEFERWAKSRANFMATILREALAEHPAHQHIEHCLWARNGNQPCPHVQPAQQEPVAKVIGHSKLENESVSLTPRIVAIDQSLQVNTMLYTSPPAQRKPLTDEEIEFIRVDQEFTEWAISEGAFRYAARAIEAAHGIKGDA